MPRRSPLVLALALCGSAFAQDKTPVTADNFVRAETDLYFAAIARDGGFGRFHHTRQLAPIEQQNVIRLNRDTLYSSAVFDLDAGPVTVTLPEPDGRFMSLQIINQDHYTPAVLYAPAEHSLTRENVGTRYVALAVRTFVDPHDADDLKAAQALQDGIGVSQPDGPGRLEAPNWDPASQQTVREALLVLNAGLPDTNGMFGRQDEVNPVRHLIGSAAAWGGNPEREATYLNVTPEKNDGRTVYRLQLKEVPVDAFWSISVYNADGYYQANPLNAYTLNNLTARKAADGAIQVQFGDCSADTPNCLPIMNGWNYLVRLYRPRAEILEGQWRFPEAQPGG
jgi:hypothetical protein